MSELKNYFTENGFAIVRNTLSADDCRGILLHEQGPTPEPVNWRKGRAASDSMYAYVGSHPSLVNPVKQILGKDVVLWGVDILVRRPNDVHPWHCDIESCDPDGGFVSVWIGIANTSKDSSLNVVSKSHKFNKTIQEFAHETGVDRSQVNLDHIAQWARSMDPQCNLVKPEVGNGDAVIFDGRLWHGTHNIQSEGTRVAILLQYAEASRPVKMIDFRRLSWPLHFIEDVRPPVIVVSGEGDASKNLIVDKPPVPSQPSR